MTDNQTVKGRLIAYIKYLGIGQGKFEAQCGLANGYVNNIRKSITPEKLQNIARQNPNLNTGWLMTGEGSMLKSSISQTANGDHNTQVAGNANHVNNSSTLDKALDEISQQRQLVEKSHELTANAQRQIDRLLAIIEKMQDK